MLIIDAITSAFTRLVDLSYSVICLLVRIKSTLLEYLTQTPCCRCLIFNAIYCIIKINRGCTVPPQGFFETGSGHNLYFIS